jgi:hypothetical protein
MTVRDPSASRLRNLTDEVSHDVSAPWQGGLGLGVRGNTLHNPKSSPRAGWFPHGTRVSLSQRRRN